MTDQNEAQSAHPTLHAGHTGVVVSQLLDEDWTPAPDPSSNASTEAIDGVLHLTADLARNYGLLQLSDKYDEQDFTEEDETQLTHLAQLTAKTLDAIHRMHRE